MVSRMVKNDALWNLLKKAGYEKQWDACSGNCTISPDEN